jgi:hypothetical protein
MVRVGVLKDIGGFVRGRILQEATVAAPPPLKINLTNTIMFELE